MKHTKKKLYKSLLGRKYILLCSFEFEKENYLISKDTATENIVCHKVCRSFCKRAHISSAEVSDEAFEIAKELYHEHSVNPFKYIFDGENYQVKSFSSGEKKYYRFKVKETDSISLGSCLLQNVFGVIVAYFYAKLWGVMWITSIIPISTRAIAIAIIIAIEIIGGTVFFFINKRNEYYISNIVIPVGLITVIGLVKVSKIALIVISLVILVCIAYSIFVNYQNLSTRAYKDDGLDDEINHTKGIWPSVIFIIVCACLTITTLFGIQGSKLKSNSKTDISELETINQNYESACQVINKDNWNNCTNQEKIDALQSISDYECSYTFGCENATVQSGCVGEEGLLGSYSDKSNVIMINNELLESENPVEAVETLLHETRHVYQHAVIDVYNKVESKLDDKDKNIAFFKYAESARDNKDAYNSGLLDYYSYYEQYIEADSRKWAGIQMNEKYFDIILGDSKQN